MSKRYPPKPFNTVEYNEIWYSDLGKFAEQHFGGKLDMHVVMDFPSQDSYRTLTVPTDRYWAMDWNHPSDDESPELIAKIREKLARGISRSDEDDSVGIEAIMDLLYDDNVIPEGDYLIKVWW